MTNDDINAASDDCRSWKMSVFGEDVDEMTRERAIEVVKILARNHAAHMKSSLADHKFYNDLLQRHHREMMTCME